LVQADPVVAQGFRFVQSTQFVQRLAEAVELSNSSHDGFGEPSCESIQVENGKSLGGRWSKKCKGKNHCFIGDGGV